MATDTALDLESQAFRAFQDGRYGECEALLEKAAAVAKSISSVANACNRVSCRVFTHPGLDIHYAHYMQWLEICNGRSIIMRDDPLGEEAVHVLPALSCNVALLQLFLGKRYTAPALLSHISKTIYQSQIQASLPSVMPRLVFLASVQSLLTGGAESPLLEQFLSRSEMEGDVFDRLVKLQLKFADCPSVRCQLTYKQAWDAYNAGCYDDALTLLALPTVSASARLLAGCCYAKLNKPNLALCSYKQCLLQPSSSFSSSSSSSSRLLAMANACEVLRGQGSFEDELQLRLMLVQALKKFADRKVEDVHCETRSMTLWMTPSGRALSMAAPAVLDPAVVARRTAVRAMELHKFEVASQLLKEQLSSPSSLLLRAKSLLCLGEFGEAMQLCLQLETTVPSLPPSKEQCDSHHHNGVLVLVQALYLGSQAAFNLFRIPEAYGKAERCVGLCRLMQQVGWGGPLVTELCLRSFCTLALISVGCKHNDRALQLLIDAIAMAKVDLDTPPTYLIYNYCLVWLKLGKVRDSAHLWLGHRWKASPWEAGELQTRLALTKSTLGTMNRSEEAYHFTVLDCTMLDIELSHQ